MQNWFSIQYYCIILYSLIFTRLIMIKQVNSFSYARKFLFKRNIERLFATNEQKGRVSVVAIGNIPQSSAPISLNPPKGTRDFYPEDQRMKLWLFDIWKDVSTKFGFEEYDAPVVEHIELYTRKAGEEVSQQLYEFEDKSGRRLSLRPEMTPSLARMITAKRGSLRFPLKWFSIPQCWRYERSTRGRRREHYQWNMDIFGVSGVEAEAELLAAIVNSFQAMGLTEKDVGLKINSRKLLNDVMRKVGIPPEKWVAAAVLIDKLDKVPDLSALKNEIETFQLDFNQIQDLTNNLKQCSTLNDFIHLIGEDSEGIQEIQKLFSLLAAYSIDSWFVFDPSVVRGLAYYTGIVFEGFDRDQQLRAICGGGRYNKLLSTLGYTSPSSSSSTTTPASTSSSTAHEFSTTGDIPAVGFGFGDAVIIELLRMKKLITPEQFENPSIDCIAYAMNTQYYTKLLPMIMQLRNQGQLNVDLILDEKKLKWIFSKGDRIGCKYVLLLGEDEDKLQQVTIKDLKLGKQFTIPQTDLLSFFLEQKYKNPST